MSDAMPDAEYLETQFDKFVFRVRRGCLYTAQDLWLKPEDGGMRVGLTDLAQRLAGDVAFCKLAHNGTTLARGGQLAEVETIKTTMVVASPIDGELLAANEALADQPELINEDPYGEGWLALIDPRSDLALMGLLDAEAYLALMQKRLAEEDRKRRGASGVSADL